MSFKSLLAHNVTIVHPGTVTDRYGNVTKNWSTATRVEVKGWVTQVARTESLDRREAQVSDWVLFVDQETAIVGADRAEWNDVDPVITFEVDGPPRPAWSPRGGHHIEASLRVVSG